MNLLDLHQKLLLVEVSWIGWNLLPFQLQSLHLHAVHRQLVDALCKLGHLWEGDHPSWEECLFPLGHLWEGDHPSWEVRLFPLGHLWEGDHP